MRAPSHGPASGDSAAPNGAPPPLRLAVCSWSLRPDDPAALVAAVRRLGLDAIQLALVPAVEEPRRWGDIFARLADAGIAPVSGMLATVGEDYSTLKTIELTGGVRPTATWPATRDLAARVSDLAAERGIPLVTFHAGFIPHDRDDPARAIVLERLRSIVDRASDVGVAVAFETGQESAETLLAALADLDRPVGINFDPANMLLYGMGDPIEAIEALAGAVVQVHAKDALPSSAAGAWGREVPIGAGAVDWIAFIDRVRRLPRSVNVVIEREAGESREEDIARGIALIRGIDSTSR
ncbi:MAG TPA: sugar phosphate isomerase/epimerase family protein [Phycisphaerales bacterium]|nr:sugar phosphate isomerase/epimerase family protein [Phycisphaerales bacterium]HMP37288.1 sugar phosphate isomerase/epimerase family protein [Phycisphaerales bacterium]